MNGSTAIQKAGSSIAMETKYSSEPVLVNLVIQKKLMEKKGERERGQNERETKETNRRLKKSSHRQFCCHYGQSQSTEISQHSALYLWRWTLMKNTTRRPPLIIHSAPKQSQRGHLEKKKVEADSPFTASQHPTLHHPLCSC